MEALSIYDIVQTIIKFFLKAFNLMDQMHHKVAFLCGALTWYGIEQMLLKIVGVGRIIIIAGIVSSLSAGGLYYVYQTSPSFQQSSLSKSQ